MIDRTPFPLAPTVLPGGKGARKAFLLSQGKLCSAKMLLAPHMSLLRIIFGGAAAPPNLPEFSDCLTLFVAQSLWKNNTPVKRGYVAEIFCNILVFSDLPCGCLLAPRFVYIYAELSMQKFGRLFQWAVL
ncbi:MAG: hypothetical protein IJJ80_01365 [Clostridia bacterium]|nr:hypothetical protein [Clostridia bacterium]